MAICGDVQGVQIILPLKKSVASPIEQVDTQSFPSELILLYIPMQIVHFLFPFVSTYAYPKGQDETQFFPSELTVSL